MSKTINLKEFSTGDWLSNNEANDWIDAHIENVFEIKTDKLLEYINTTEADAIRVFETKNPDTNKDALIIKCFKDGTERYYNDIHVLEHIEPINKKVPF